MSAAKRNQFFSNEARGNARRRGRRQFGSIETLERRELMAGDLGTSLYSLAPIGGPSVGVYANITTNDSIPTATDLGLVQGIKTTTGAVGTGDANDYFRIVMDEPGNLKVTLDQLSANLDMALYNSAGQQLGLSTRTGTSAETIGFLGLNAGNYYARVATGSSTANSNYRLTVNVDIAGDTLANARNLGNAPASGSHTFTDWVGPGDGNDYFKFNVTQKSQINLKLDQLTGDADLYLYDNNGKQIGNSRKTGTSAEQITGNGSGTFYVRVVPYSSAQANYRLSIGLGSPATPPPPSTGEFHIDLNMSGLTANQQNIISQAARRWEQVITSDLPNVQLSNGEVIDDLRIDVSVVSIDGAYGTAGNGGYERLRANNLGGLPYYGTFRLDSADVARMEQAGTLFSVALHEMGHVLGLGTLWSSRGLLGNMNTSNPGYYGRAATAAYNQIFSASSSGVPVDASGGHWRENVLGSELMTPTRDGSAPLSIITIGSLADLGYGVNYNSADAFGRSTAAIMLGPGSGSSIATASSAAVQLAEDSHDGHSCPSHQVANSPASTVRNAMAPARGARHAAFESWSRPARGHDFSRESVEAVRAAFDSAWDDLASETIRLRVA